MAKIQIIGEDINAIVYKYLMERGYKHTAYVFESEAKVDPDKVFKRKIAPYLLPTLLEKALLLKYLELHPDPEETQVCEAPVRLLEDHHCDIAQRTMLGKRDFIRRSQNELHMEILERIKEVDREPVEKRSLITPTISMFDENKLTNPPMLAALAKSKSSMPERKDKKEQSKREENPQMNKSMSMKEEETNGVTSTPAALKPSDYFSTIETKDTVLLFNPDVIETYFDGSTTNLLLKVKEGSASCYFVSQLTASELVPQFILPQEVLNQAQHSVSLVLRKHLILVSETGEMSFINYQSKPEVTIGRSLENKLTFSMKPPKQIVHDYNTGIYVVVCDRKTYVVDDTTFNLKREIVGAFEHCSINLDGKMLMVNDQNQMSLLDFEDKSYSYSFNVGESKIEAASFGTLGLFLSCKLVNPYGVSVWMMDKPECLFTFNENLKFSDFSVFDSRLTL